MEPNPDNRADNVERIQHNIDMTIDNIQHANEMVEKTSDQKMKQTLKYKNERLMDVLGGIRDEIKDEAKLRKTESFSKAQIQGQESIWTITKTA